MFSLLLKFEFLYQISRRVSWLLGIVFFLLGFIFGGQSYVPENISYNSPYEIASKIGLLSLGAVFAIMFFSINGVIRDKQYKIEPILYTTKIDKLHFFGIRFLGVLLLSLLIFSITLLGFFIGVSTSPLDPSRVLPFNFAHYFWIWLLFILPNIMICVSIIFSVSILSKNAIATYATAIFIYAFYWMCSIFFNSPLLASSNSPSEGNMIIAALLDPFGLSAFFQQTQFWTAAQKNTQLVSFSGYFFWNRVLWFSISAITLLTTFKLFSFRKMSKKVKTRVRKINKTTLSIKEYKSVKAMDFSFKSSFYRLISLLKIELKTVFKSLPFIAVVLVWVVIVFTEIFSRVNSGGEYNETLYPTTNLIIWLIKDPLPILGYILIVLYSGELVWRSRSLNFYKILDVAPTSNVTFYISQLTTLILLPFLLIAISIVIGITIQIIKGYFNFEIEQYLGLFYFSGIGFVFYAVFALLIQSIVNNKYLGMLLTGAFMILFNSSLLQTLGVYHPLFFLGSLPEVLYTNMTGYGDYAKPFHYFALHWIILAFILAIITSKLWKRGDIKSLTSRIKEFNRLKNKKSLISLVCLTIIFIGTTISIYYNTSVVTTFTTTDENLNLREGYERKYKSYDGARKLAPVDIKTQVDLYPNEGKYIVRASYVLKNKSKDSVTQLLISDRTPITKIELQGAVLVEHDSIFSTRLYRFKKAVLPDEKLAFNYEVVYEKKGFETSNILVKNGTFLLHNFFEPSLGYRNGFEIQNQFERLKRGLPERTEEQENISHFDRDNAQYEKIFFETIVSTQSNQIALAPGSLIKEWKDGNRNYYHYKTQHKVIPQFGYFSAAYKVEKEDYNGIPIEQFYYPKHNYNISNMSDNIKNTLEYCESEFGKYQFDHIRLLEIPGHWNFGGVAQAGTIAMVEDNVYLIDGRDQRKFNLVARRTIHEVVHQWIGHLLTPRNTHGSGVITEGLTKYLEIVLMEKHYGKKSVWQLSQTSNRQYFQGRTFETNREPTLLTEQGQAYMLYGKSTVIMLALKELIGSDKINGVIKKLIDTYGNDIEPRATLTDFLNELFLVTPEEYHTLISDWFTKRIIYDLKADEVSCVKQENGKYKVVIDITALRFNVNEKEETEELSINEPIQIGAFSKHPSIINNQKEIFYLKPHHINKKQNQIIIELDTKPNFVAIDPFGARLEENRNNNLIQIK